MADVHLLAEQGVVEIQNGGASPVVVVSFAGWARGHGGVATPEFSRTVAGLPADFVFLCDPNDRAYVGGVAGAGANLREIAAWLRETCARRGARRIVTMGNSTGGWAAILFGLLVGADEVLTFTPKTRICGQEDFHEPGRYARVAECIRDEGDLLDLRGVFERTTGRRPRIQIHYPSGDALDVRHAKHFEGLPGVRFHEYDFDRHTLVRALRDHGVLRPLVANAIAGNDRGSRLTALRGRLLVARARRREALLRPLWRAVSTPC